MSHLQTLRLLPREAWFSCARSITLSVNCIAVTIFLMRRGIYLVLRLFYGLKGCTSSWEGRMKAEETQHTVSTVRKQKMNRKCGWL